MARKKILEIACQAGISCARTLETVYAGKAMVYEDNTVKVVPELGSDSTVIVPFIAFADSDASGSPSPEPLLLFLPPT